jgi:hypothetical protein
VEVRKVHDTINEVPKCLDEIPPAMERLAISVHFDMVMLGGEAWSVAVFIRLKTLPRSMENTRYLGELEWLSMGD